MVRMAMVPARCASSPAIATCTNVQMSMPSFVGKIITSTSPYTTCVKASTASAGTVCKSIHSANCNRHRMQRPSGPPHCTAGNMLESKINGGKRIHFAVTLKPRANKENMPTTHCHSPPPLSTHKSISNNRNSKRSHSQKHHQSRRTSPWAKPASPMPCAQTNTQATCRKTLVINDTYKNTFEQASTCRTHHTFD